MSRILIVEDELDLANIIKDYLEKELYEVEICTEGDKAIEIFDKFKWIQSGKYLQKSEINNKALNCKGT